MLRSPTLYSSGQSKETETIMSLGCEQIILDWIRIGQYKHNQIRYKFLNSILSEIYREDCIHLDSHQDFLMPWKIICRVIPFTYTVSDRRRLCSTTPITTANSSRVNKMFSWGGTLIITFICSLLPNWVIMKCSVIETALGEAGRLWIAGGAAAAFPLER